MRTINLEYFFSLSDTEVCILVARAIIGNWFELKTVCDNMRLQTLAWETLKETELGMLAMQVVMRGIDRPYFEKTVSLYHSAI